MIGRVIGRLVLVPLGFVLATAAAAFILFSLGMEKVTHAVHGRDADFADIQRVWGMLKDLKGLATFATLAPPLLLVIIGEVARIRSSTYYIVGGGASLAALPLLARSGSLGDSLAQIGIIWQVFATAGFVGGFVYWMVAGRRA